MTWITGVTPRTTKSVLVLRLVERLLLLGRGFLAVLGLPLLVRHAVDDLARLGIGYFDALLARLLAIPARQAIAAETGQVHQVDVLHVRARPQMLDQAAEGGGLEFGLGLVVHGNAPSREIWAQPKGATMALATAAPIGWLSRRPHSRALSGVSMRSCRTSSEQCGRPRGLACAVSVYSYEARAE